MDLALSLAIGLCLRLTLRHGPFRALFLGIWEGVCLYEQTQADPRSPDPYLAHSLRLFYDLAVTQSLIVTLLWTVLTMLILSATDSGSPSLQHRHDINEVPLSSTPRIVQVRPRMSSTSTAHPAVNLAEPSILNSRPSAPLARQLDCDPELIPANHSFFTPIEDAASPSSSSTEADDNVLPTPPITPVREALLHRRLESPHRLSTVPEEGSMEEEYSAAEVAQFYAYDHNDFDDDFDDSIAKPIPPPDILCLDLTKTPPLSPGLPTTPRWIVVQTKDNSEGESL
jgi:hypothetical protein